jgi:DNA-binding response OmpR family regulator
MKRILLIGEDQAIANIYRNEFAAAGFQVEIALDGAAGLETARGFRPEAVILDLVLPKVSGVEVIRKLRAEAEWQKLPIIAFSNTYLTNLVQEAWKAGATKCLSKANCTPKQVIELVRGVFSGNGAPAKGAAGHAVAQPSPVTPTAPAAASGKAGATEDASAQDLRKSVIECLPATLSALRAQLQGLIKADGEPARVQQAHEMCRRLHTLAANAGLAGLLQIAQIADALEALLKELHEKPRNINASTLRTVASATDFLAILFERGLEPDQQEVPPANILVVDDEAISRRAVIHALEKAKLTSVSVHDPEAAYHLLSENKFELIFLDVDMPGMTGFELCAKLRTLPIHKKTPVVFVTSLNDLISRANSTMSGGTDFIAKPFLFIELAVKALVYVRRPAFDISRRAH